MSLITIDVISTSAAAAAAFAARHALNSKTRHTFNDRFFSKPCCIATVIAAGLVFFGCHMQHRKGHTSSDFYDGYRCIVLGVIVYLPVAFCNFLKTNLFVSAGGTLTQLIVMPAAFLIGGSILALGVPLVAIASLSPPYRVQVVHHYID